MLSKNSPNLNSGRIEGDVAVIDPENVNVNAGHTIQGTLHVPGNPTINGSTQIIQGSGSTEPSSHTIGIHNKSTVDTVEVKTEVRVLPVVTQPADSSGTVDAVLSVGGSLGDPAQLRDLVLQSGYGSLSLPAGNYGDITIKKDSTLVLGVAGQVSEYVFTSLTLQKGAGLEVLGSVQITLRKDLHLNGAVAGDESHPEWLTLSLFGGNAHLNAKSTFYGHIDAALGNVHLNASSQLIGSVRTEMFSINGRSLLRYAPREIVVVNQAPSANSASYEVVEDTSIQLELTGVDPEGQPLTYTITAQPQHGTLSGTAPLLTYTPAAGYAGSDQISFVVSDGVNTSATAVIDLNVLPVNDAPTAESKVYSLDEDTSVNVLLAGSDQEGEALSYNVLNQPLHGQVTGTSPNLVYTPDANFFGQDSFTYKVNDGELDSEIATINLTVDAVNDQPVANAQSLSTAEDQNLTIQLTGSDVEGDVLSYTIKTQPLSGVLSGAGADWVYTPNPDYHGDDSFTFVVNDGSLESEEVQVSITVTPVNDAPVATNASLQLAEDGSVVVTFTGSDVDGDSLSYVPSQPLNGALVDDNGSWVYTPNANFHGEDSIAFQVADPSGATASGVISLTVTPVNDDPVASSDSFGLNEDTSLQIVFQATDVDGDSLTYTPAQPQHGSLVNNAGNWVYTPQANYHGTDSISFTVADGNGGTDTGTLTLTVLPVNDAPLAVAQSVQVNEDESLLIDQLGTDPDGDALTFTASSPAHGTLTVQAGQWLYVPAADYHGADSFSITVNDGNGGQSSAQVTITVVPVNDDPVAQAQSVETPEDNAVLITLNATDVDGDALSYQVNQPANGTLTQQGENWLYTPNENFYGADSFIFTVTDGNGGSSAAQVNITVQAVNDAPVVSNINVRSLENATVTLPLIGEDLEGDSLSYELVTQPSHGLIVQGSQGEWSYTTNTDFSGIDTATYRAFDGTEYSTAGQIIIVVDAAPKIVISSPVEDSEHVLGDQLMLSATASDKDDSIVVTRLYLNDDLLLQNAGATASYDGSGLASGIYVVRAESVNSDGILVRSEDVRFTIKAQNKPPVVSAGSDQTYALDAVFLNELVINGSNEEEMVDGVPAGWNVVSGNWGNGQPSGAPAGLDGVKIFAASNPDTNELMQDIDLSSFENSIDKGVQYFQLKAFIRSLPEPDRLDKSNIILEYKDASGAVLEKQHFNPTPVSDRWLLVSDLRAAPIGSRVARIRLIADFNLTGTSNDAYFDSVSFVPLKSPVVYLSGEVEDDGLLTDKPTHRWEQVSGAHSEIINKNALLTQLALPLPGQYVFRLIADDGEFAVEDTVIVSVSPPGTNLPPVVQANDDFTVPFSSSGIEVGAVITDDTFVGRESAEILWTKVEGPADISFADPFSSATEISFREPGRYVFRISVFDGEYTVSDDIIVHLECTDDDVPYDIAIMIDHSGSMGSVNDPSSNVSRARQGAIRLLESLNYSLDSVALGSLSSVSVPFTNDPDTLILSVPNITGSSSNTDTGISLGYEEIVNNGRSNARKLVIVLADGNATQSTTGADLAKDAGVRVVTIGLGGSVNDTYLKRLATSPSDYYFIKDSNDIDAVFQSISRSFCRFVNLAPVVYAGTEQAITSAEESVFLSGSYLDDGVPTGAVYAREWVKISGPGEVIFSERTSLTPEVTFSDPGVYVLELRVDDGNKVGSARTRISVGSGCKMIIAPNATAWWSGSDVATDRIGGIQARPSAFTARYRPGKVGTAFSFNNSNLLYLGTNPATQIDEFDQGFTVEGWFQVENNYTYLFSFGDYAGVDITSSNLYFRWRYFLNGSLQSSAATIAKINDVRGSVDDYFHVAITYDAETALAKVFVNGELTFSRVIPQLVLSELGELTLGGVTGDSTLLNGGIDEFTIYERPLNQNEVINIVEAGDHGKCPESKNQAPFVDAGESVFLPAGVQNGHLNAFATDDTGIRSIAWEAVKTPIGGTITIDDLSNLKSSFVVTTDGYYLLRLTVSDGVQQMSDYVVVRVGSPCGVGAGDGVVSWWGFDGTSENQVAISPTSWDRYAHYEEGNVGYALSINEASESVVVEASENHDLDSFVDGFTQECWINPSASNYLSIYRWGDSGSYLRQSGSSIQFYYLRGQGGSTIGRTIGQVTIDGSTWSHVAVTYDKASGLLVGYLNGEQVFSVIDTVYLGSNTDLVIGSRPTATSTYRGKIDELTFYNKALSAAKVLSIYQAGESGKCPGPRNHAPVVDAGPDIMLASVSDIASVNASVSDPEGQNVAVHWEQRFGAGVVSFSAPDSVNTQISASAPGMYVIALVANDGYATSEDLVSLRVDTECRAMLPDGALFWLHSEGSTVDRLSGQAGESYGYSDYVDGIVGKALDTSKLATNGLSYTGVPNALLHDGVEGFTFEAWMSLTPSRYIKVIDWGGGFYLKQSGSYFYFYYQDANLNTRAVSLGSAISSTEFAHYAFTYDPQTKVLRAFTNGSLVREVSNVTMELSAQQALTIPKTVDPIFIDELTLYKRVLSYSEIYAIYSAGMYGKCVPGENLAPLVDAGSDIKITSSVDAAQLNGKVVDDGVFAVEWKVSSAPEGSQVTFVDSTALQTSASFTVDGVYLLELEVKDEYHTRRDLVMVHVADVCLESIPEPEMWFAFNLDLRDNMANRRFELIEGLAEYESSDLSYGLAMTGVRAVLPESKAPHLAGGEGYTIDFWLKAGEIDRVYGDLLTWNTSKSSIYLSYGRLYARWYDDSGYPYSIYLGDMTLDKNWQHVALVIDVENLQLRGYIDGVLYRTTALRANYLYPLMGDILFGAEKANESTFDGVIDELALTESVLTGEQIQLLATQPISGRCVNHSANTPPLVEVGGQRAVQLPNAAITLKGLAVDREQESTQLSYSWTLQQGPVGYSYSGSNAAQTDLQFSIAGEYLFNLAVSDGELATTKHVRVIVLPEINSPPIANAGQDTTVYFGESISLEGSAQDDGLPNGTLTYQWRQVSGPEIELLSSLSAQALKYIPLSGGRYVFELHVSDGEHYDTDQVVVDVPLIVNQPPVVDAGEDELVRLENGKTLTLHGLVTDDGLPGLNLEVQWRQTAGPVANLEKINDTDALVLFAEPGNYQFSLIASDGVMESSDSVSVTVVENNDPPVLVYNGDLLVNSNTGSLSVLATDDGKVQPLSYTWTQISGPQAVIANPQLAATQVTFSDYGVYGFRVEVSDGQFASNLDISIGYPDPDGNKPPQVSLLSEYQVVLPSPLTMSASITDDAKTSETVDIQWTVLSNPDGGAATISDATVTNPTIEFSEPGAYQLQVSVSDGEYTTTAQTTVIVRTNTPPSLSLQTEYTIVQPSGQQLMTVSVQDDGLPSGSLSYQWVQVSGPAESEIVGANEASATAQMSIVGDYLFSVTVSDSQDSSTALVVVHVVEAGNQAPVIEELGIQNIQLGSLYQPVPVVSDDTTEVENLIYQWRVVYAPEGALYHVNDLDVASPEFSFYTVGSYVIELAVSDGELQTRRQAVVSVVDIPKLEMIYPFNSSAIDDQGIVQYVADVFSGGQVVTKLEFYLDNVLIGEGTRYQDTVRFVYNAGVPSQGSHSAYAKVYVTNGQSYVSEVVSFEVVDYDEEQLDLSLASPIDGDTVSSKIAVTGTAYSNFLDQYILEYRVKGDTFAAWKAFHRGYEPVVNGVLGYFDSSLLENGLYEIRARALSKTGAELIHPSVGIILEGNLKIGHFALAFEDLSVAMPGVPLSVTRTYDSRDNSQGDFGPGWQLGLKGVEVLKTRNLQEDWEMQVVELGGILQAFYTIMDSTNRKRVIVKFPDGRTEVFEASIDAAGVSSYNLFGDLPENGVFLQAVTGGKVIFKPVNGALGKLEITNGGEFYCFGNEGPKDINIEGGEPTEFRYTEEDGTSYLISTTLGLKELTDRQGNKVTIQEDGIYHSAGENVLFTRDAANGNRITAVTDPAGNQILYGYDEQGRLASVMNRENEVTTMLYENVAFPNYLTSILDPRGVQAIRTEYDDDGRMIKQVDADGNAIEFEHDLANNREIIRDRLGNVTIHEYDDFGNVIRTTDALGGVTTRAYDAQDNEISVTTPEGVTTSRTFDSKRNVTSETDGLGHVTSYSFNDSSQPTTIVDALGQATTFGYNAATGNLTALTDAVGTTTSFGYSGSNLASLTDANGVVTSFSHDSLGREQGMTVKDAAGNVLRSESYTYDDNGNRLTTTTTRTKQDGTVDTLVTSFTYDAENRVRVTTLPDGSTTEVIYNSFGKQQKTIDQLQRETLYEYDDRGNLVKTTYHDNTFSTTTYDLENRSVASTNRMGVTTYFVYDALGRMTATILPDDSMPASVLDSVADILASSALADNPRTVTEYDADGRVVASIDALGNRTEFEYDAAGRRTLVRDALGKETLTTYNAVGSQVSVTDALNRTTSFVYDDANRLVQTVFPDASTTSVSYDSLGRRQSVTDQEGNVTSFEYDDLGRMVAVVDAEGFRTEYDYNERGDLLVQRDALGRETSYLYDKLGRRIGRTLPEGQSESVAYNVLGNMTSRTDFNGHTTTYTYNSRDLLEVVTADTSHPSLALAHAPAKFEYGYDSIGRRISATVKGSSNNVLYQDGWSYDLRGRLSQHSSSNGTLDYSYDANSNLLSAHSNRAGGYDQSYSYDALNRLEKLYQGRDAGRTEIAGYSYNAVGSLANVSYQNGIGHEYFYNSLNRLTGLDVAKNGVAAVQQGYAYTLNKAGHRTKIEEASGRVIDHVFDKLYRLKQESIAGSLDGRNGSIDYVLDAVGNRTSRTASTTSLLELLPDQNFSYTNNDLLSHHSYDANGSTTSSPQADYPVTKDEDGATRAGTNGDIYDFRGKLLRRNRGDGSYVDCHYNADGDRIRKEITDDLGIKVKDDIYLIDRNTHTGYAQVVEEVDVNGLLTARYHYGHDLVAVDRKASAGANVTRDFYSYDGHGSVRAITDEYGDLLEEYDYDAFGIMLAFRQWDAGTGMMEDRDVADYAYLSKNRYLYTGEQYDADLGMYYLRARYTNTQTGRFHSMDSYEGRRGEPLTLHKYLYTHANPVSYTDPSGEFILSNFKYGKIVHDTIGYHFVADAPTRLRYDDQTIKTILATNGSPSNGEPVGARLRPDLVDWDSAEVWEIKPMLSSQGALAQVMQYITLLSLQDRRAVIYTPGISYIPPSIVYVEPHIRAFTWVAAPGVILYYLLDTQELTAWGLAGVTVYSLHEVTKMVTTRSAATRIAI
ncbi:tandem-95 repeat protein [Rubritalea squalenifaciens]|uniref:tandem-95 repeat protein n=1 Tax=Rubritalea squalenifaciens TaxID=407226 RepID=UPI0013566BE2|nr:Ig-like domain-containing protein [Rubritalea squalenifaciens]